MKKQIKKISLGLVLCSLFSVIKAQNVNLDMVTESNLMSKNISSKVIAEGSPYINEKFSQIRITQYKARVFNARYNAYNGEMEVMTNENKVIALDNNVDFEVTFTTPKKIYRSISYVTDKDMSKRGFLVVLSDNDNNSLFKEERIKYYEKVEASSSYQQDKPAKFDRIGDSYYIMMNDKVTFVPQKKKDFLKAFPNQANQLKSYMKANKLSPKDEDELINIINYLSTITE